MRCDIASRGAPGGDRCPSLADHATGTGPRTRRPTTGGRSCWQRPGEQAQVAVLERDPRCAMVTLDPDAAEPDPNAIRRIVQAPDAMAGV